MIKDAKGSKDGWYWGEFWSTQCMDNNNPPFAVPYCGLRTLLSALPLLAEKEHTFSYARNIKGFPGEPDTYFVDLSWTNAPRRIHQHAPPCGATAESDYANPRADTLRRRRIRATTGTAQTETGAEFIGDFGSKVRGLLQLNRPVPVGNVSKIPVSLTITSFRNTWVHSRRRSPSPESESVSDLRLPAWLSQRGTYGNVMFYTGVKQADGSIPTMNVSPFGEWRWSPMGPGRARSDLLMRNWIARSLS